MHYWHYNKAAVVVQNGQTLIGGRLRVVVLDTPRGKPFRGYGHDSQ